MHTNVAEKAGGSPPCWPFRRRLLENFGLRGGARAGIAVEQGQLAVKVNGQWLYKTRQIASGSNPLEGWKE